MEKKRKREKSWNAKMILKGKLREEVKTD